ncbi:MAG: hypothetical protein JWP49_2637 [Phenylobacterium sp.]|jgi:hypothetical protein|nr:hypothetical protein [Phenylobacterium sp.]
MPQQLIFAPMGVLALLTFTVLGIIPMRRIGAGRAGRITADDFRFGESARVPDEVVVANRVLVNLLEVPLLFYVACLMYVVAGKVDGVALVLAWTYVALRLIHALIYLTYNRVLHRAAPFVISNVVLVVFWVLFFVR